MVDVEQHALRAFEQDPLTLRLGLRQHTPHRLGIGQDEVGDLAQFGDQALAVDRGFVEAARSAS